MARKILVGTVILGVLAGLLAISPSPRVSAQTMEPPPTSWMTWDKFAGNVYGTGVDEDSRGNLIVSGWIAPNPDMVLALFSSRGRQKWATFPGGGWLHLFDYGQAALATSDGGYLLAGTMGYYEGDPIEANKRRAACLIKFNAHGKLLWQQLYKDYTPSGFNSVVEDFGTYVAAGYCGNPQRILVVKVFADSGWLENAYVHQRYNLTAVAKCIQAFSVGGQTQYILCGQVVTSNKGVYVLKLDNQFGFLADGGYFETGVDSLGYSVVPANDGNGFVVAAALGDITSGTVSSLMRFDAALSIMGYPTVFAAGLLGEAHCIQSTGVGYVVAGVTGPPDLSQSSAYVMHVFNDLTLDWQWGYGGPSGSHFSANYVIQTKDGGFVVCGYDQNLAKPGDDQYSLFLAKLGGVTHGKK